ncbi:hypothetical protein ABZ611_16490 [Streptomyces sp. NPDC007861]|uniref:hypothetical protein n=1 Tax=Streptomyces sp. NPDC007861 TaxID=3154893 RepID=UPI0033D39F07
MTGRQLSSSRSALGRGGTAAVAALVLAAGAVPLLAPEARAGAKDDPAGLTLPAPDRYAPVEDTLYLAGDTGYLHRRETGDGSTAPYQWRGYDGTERTVENFTGTLPGQYGHYAAGSDTLPVPNGASGVVQLRDPATGESTALTVPDGQYTAASFGNTVLTFTYNEVWQIDKLHILRTTDGVTGDITVEPPEELRFDRQPVLAGDGRHALVRFLHAYEIGLIDLATGSLTRIAAHPWTDDPVKLQAALSPTHIAWYQQGSGQARVVRRDDPTGTQTAVTVPTGPDGTSAVGLAGDWLLSSSRVPSPGLGGPLYASPLDGGAARTLLAHAQDDLVQIPGGGVVVVGGAASGDWAVRRVETAADGAPVLRTLAEVPARPAVVRGISLAGGHLVTRELDSAARPAYQTRQITLGTSPAAGPRSELADAPLNDAYGQPLGTGDGGLLHMRYDAAAQRDVLVRTAASGATTETLPFDRPAPESSGLGLRDTDGRYALYGGGNERVVIDLDAPGGGAVVHTVNQSAAALWDGDLWTTNGAWGEIESRDLATGAVTRLSVGADCQIMDMQAVGRWVYWDCLMPNSTGNPAEYPFGVHDLATGKDIGLPARGRLGNGFVVAHDKSAGELRLTDFHTGTATAPRVLGLLPALPGTAMWKNHDVDKFGGDVAWLDADGTAHAAPGGVPGRPVTVDDPR